MQGKGISRLGRYGAISLLLLGLIGPLRGEPAITPEDVLQHVRYLAHDELEGRAAGTPGAELAARYIAAWFAHVGLKPLGDRGTFLQEFEFTAGARLGPQNACRAWVGGREQELELHRDFLPLPFSTSGTVEGEVVFAGYGIQAPQAGYDDYAGLEVKDKVVLVLRSSPAPLSRYAPLRSKARTARSLGAKAILFFTGPASQPQDEVGPFEAAEGRFDAGLPAAFLSRRVAAEWLRAGGIEDVAAWQERVAQGPSPDSRPLPQVRVRLTCDVVKERRRTSNVVGLLEGQDPQARQEYVVIGAHYDHVGRGEYGGARGRQGEIHNGADDNASGTAGVIELAEFFASQPQRPERSLLFVAFGAEEIGLLGSSHFVNHPPVPLERIRAMINLDMIGRSPDGSVQVLGALTAEEWPEIVQVAGREVEVPLKMGSSFVGGSDHQPFQNRGIPILFFFTGLHPQYHTPEDDPERIQPQHEARILELVARIVRRVASSSQTLRYVKAASSGPQMGAGFRVYLGTIPDYSAEVEGVLLAGVREGGPAARAGLQGGDIIVEVDGKSVRNVEDYTAILGEAEPGKPMKVVVLRGGQRLSFQVVPEAR